MSEEVKTEQAVQPATQSKSEQVWGKILNILDDSFRTDLVSLFDKGKKAPATRLRASLKELKDLCSELRSEISETKNALKPVKSTDAPAQ